MAWITAVYQTYKATNRPWLDQAVSQSSRSCFQSPLNAWNIWSLTMWRIRSLKNFKKASTCTWMIKWLISSSSSPSFTMSVKKSYQRSYDLDPLRARRQSSDCAQILLNLFIKTLKQAFFEDVPKTMQIWSQSLLCLINVGRNFSLRAIKFCASLNLFTVELYIVWTWVNVFISCASSWQMIELR